VHVAYVTRSAGRCVVVLVRDVPLPSYSPYMVCIIIFRIFFRDALKLSSTLSHCQCRRSESLPVLVVCCFFICLVLCALLHTRHTHTHSHGRVPTASRLTAHGLLCYLKDSVVVVLTSVEALARYRWLLRSHSSE
jgi:hypothetical protein